MMGLNMSLILLAVVAVNVIIIAIVIACWKK